MQVLPEGRRRVTRSRVSDGPSAAYDPQAAPVGNLIPVIKKVPKMSQDIDQDQVCSTRGACGAVPAWQVLSSQRLGNVPEGALCLNFSLMQAAGPVCPRR